MLRDADMVVAAAVAVAALLVVAAAVAVGAVLVVAALVEVLMFLLVQSTVQSTEYRSVYYRDITYLH